MFYPGSDMHSFPTSSLYGPVQKQEHWESGLPCTWKKQEAVKVWVSTGFTYRDSMR